MKSCKQIETKLASAESLSNSQRQHLANCPHCQAWAAWHKQWNQLTQQLVPDWNPTQAEREQVTKTLSKQTRTGIGPRRLVLAGVALLVLMGALIVTTQVMSPAQIRPSDTPSIFQLLDEIEEIAHFGNLEGHSFWNLDSDLGADLEDFDVPLPGGYQLLNDVLEERYL